MAIFAFILGALCGILTALLGVMLLDIGLIGAIAVFFTTTYGVAMLPFLHDLIYRPRPRQG